MGVAVGDGVVVGVTEGTRVGVAVAVGVGVTGTGTGVVGRNLAYKIFRASGAMITAAAHDIIPTMKPATEAIFFQCFANI